MSSNHSLFRKINGFGSSRAALLNTSLEFEKGKDCAPRVAAAKLSLVVSCRSRLASTGAPRQAVALRLREGSGLAGSGHWPEPWGNQAGSVERRGTIFKLHARVACAVIILGSESILQESIFHCPVVTKFVSDPIYSLLWHGACARGRFQADVACIQAPRRLLSSDGLKSSRVLIRLGYTLKQQNRDGTSSLQGGENEETR